MRELFKNVTQKDLFEDSLCEDVLYHDEREDNSMNLRAKRD